MNAYIGGGGVLAMSTYAYTIVAWFNLTLVTTRKLTQFLGQLMIFSKCEAASFQNFSCCVKLLYSKTTTEALCSEAKRPSVQNPLSEGSHSS